MKEKNILIIISSQPRMIKEMTRFHIVWAKEFQRSCQEKLDISVNFQFKYDLWDGVSKVKSQDINILTQDEKADLKRFLIDIHTRHDSDVHSVNFYDSYITHRFVESIVKECGASSTVADTLISSISQLICRAQGTSSIEDSYDMIIQTRPDTFLNFIPTNVLNRIFIDMDVYLKKKRPAILVQNIELSCAGITTSDVISFSHVSAYKYFHENIYDTLRNIISKRLMQNYDQQLLSEILSAHYLSWGCLNSDNVGNPIRIGTINSILGTVALVRPERYTSDIAQIKSEDIIRMNDVDRRRKMTELYQHFDNRQY